MNIRIGIPFELLILPLSLIGGCSQETGKTFAIDSGRPNVGMERFQDHAKVDKPTLELSRDEGDSHQVRVRHQITINSQELRDFRLTDADSSNPSFLLVETQVEKFLRDFSLDPLLEVKKISEEMKSTGRQTITYGFFVNSIPVRDYFLTAHLLKDSLYFAGSVPTGEVDAEVLKNDLLPSQEELIELVSNSLAKTDLLFDGKVNFLIPQNPCLTSAYSYSFYLAACFEFYWNGVNYRGVASKSEILEIERQSFSAVAELTYFQRNPSTQAITGKFDVNDTGYLENDFFTTLSPSGTRFKFPSGTLVGPVVQDSDSFAEANVFAQANEMFSWFSSLGYNWDNTKITLKMNVTTVNVTNGSDINNAGYYPSGIGGIRGPVILVGKGDGTLLQNLSLDADVVAHELAHHMIFRTLTSTKYIQEPTKDEEVNHSGAIHEGMADFLTFARSGDSCLGESICPLGSSACWQESLPKFSGCLRDAAPDKSTFSFSSAAFKALESKPHLKGMLVSGFLWDAFVSGGKTKEFSKLVLNSIDYLVKPASTFDDLIVALFSSDAELFNGKYCAVIKQAALGRGLASKAPSDCANVKIGLKGNSSNPIIGSAGPTSQKQKVTVVGKQSGCTLSSPKSLSQIEMVLLLLPIFSQFFARFFAPFFEHFSRFIRRILF